MGVPAEYSYASEQFRTYLDALRGRLATHSSAVAYTCTDGVFRVFRARLEPQNGLKFANALPAVLRAIFVADWDIAAPRRAWADRQSLTLEIQSVRQHHNFAPDTVISDVAWALRQIAEPRAFERTLSELPPEAHAFWTVVID
ncbi:DUF2267 domain-containing protein [Pelagibacterium xiamenense]|uniref:DUF2267 domain-containing protein n=1 Tax=Pelagibacterium xiamenense TaxID=2901140 RepID=UPI001E2CAEC2|nr:DUF2267 domain-containing protein [Pelagibacterium xiamenense]MCD7061276.1 DUF2267 domain-containing protein [Pelagibacterium xiamenense]